MRYLKWLLVLALAVVIVPDLWAQFGRGGRGGRGGPGGPGGRSSRGGPPKMDPERIWGFVARGKSSIKISDLRFGRSEAEAWAKKNGISNGQLTKDQFVKYFKGRMEERERRAKLPVDQQAALYFKERDRNKDGVLDQSEMSGGMRWRMKEYDKNGDGKISKSESMAYYKKVTERFRRGNRDQGNSKNDKTQPKGGTERVVIEDIPYERPLVFAFGKLPKGTPDWYTDNDTDKDGQVALFEWRKGGKSIAEFLKLDSNQDGFISPDEMVRAEERTNGVQTASSSSPSYGTQTRDSGRRDRGSRDRGKSRNRYRRPGGR